jgi:hypothetical protein
LLRTVPKLIEISFVTTHQIAQFRLLRCAGRAILGAPKPGRAA